MKKMILAALSSALFFSTQMIHADLHNSTTISQTKLKNQPQVSGFYQYQLGNTQITALLDGTIELDPNQFKGLPPEKKNEILKKYYLDKGKGIQTSVNAFLVNDGKNLVLVDSGTASCFGESLGSIIKNLKASGHQPEDIDAILLTHLHPDHACGISSNGKASYPNANIYVAKAEADYWLTPNQVKTLPKDKQEGFSKILTQIQSAIGPYQSNKRFRTFEEGDKVYNFEVIETAGHTPGHYSYRFKANNNESVVFIGDIVHSHALQFDQPKTSVEFDVDQNKAIQTRLKQFAEIAKNGENVAAPHLPFPGIGHIYSKDAQSYQWIPITFKD